MTTARIGRVAWRNRHREPQAAGLPQKANPPTVRQLLLLDSKLALGTKKAGMARYPAAAYLGADWVTQGDWVGRYGRQCAVLCAAGSPADVLVYWGNYYGIRRSLGPEARLGDSMRAWITWKRTDNPNSLWDPAIGARRQAEHDDHGEAYKPTDEGPGLWYSIRLPAGEQRLSLYFFNKDGHAGTNRNRDYTISVFPWMANFSIISAARPLARARVEKFWGGIYQQFKLAGPGKYILVVGRNASFNTILSGIFVDRITGPSLPTDRIPPPWMGSVVYPSERLRPPPVISPQLAASWDIAISVVAEGSRLCGASGWRSAGILAYRRIVMRTHGTTSLQPLRRSLGLWNDYDRVLFTKLVKRALLTRHERGMSSFVTVVK